MAQLISWLFLGVVIQAASLALDGSIEDLQRSRHRLFNSEPAKPVLIGEMKYLVSTQQANARVGLCAFSDCGSDGRRVFAFPANANRGTGSMTWMLQYAHSLPREEIQIIIPSHGDDDSMQLGVCGKSKCDGETFGVQAVPVTAGVHKWIMEKNSSYPSGTVVRFRSPTHEDCYLGACGLEECEGANGYGLHCYKGDDWHRTKRDVHWTLVSVGSPSSWEEFINKPAEVPNGADRSLEDLEREEAARLNALKKAKQKAPDAAPKNEFPMDFDNDFLHGDAGSKNEDSQSNSQEASQAMSSGSNKISKDGAQSFLVSGRGSISRNE